MIKSVDFMKSEQLLNVNKKNKLLYGEIFTPYSLIKSMMLLIPEYVFYDKKMRWLDPGSGTGYFSIFLYYKLYSTLKDIIPNDKERSEHIITNMLFMIEINPEHCEHLKNIFGENANIFNQDFLGVKLGQEQWKFDIIIGNPPFNSKGMKKVPTNTKLKKKHDGSTIWGDFLKNSMDLLKTNGLLCFITPSIWMKPDKSRIYHYINQYKLHKLHALTNTQSNQIFKGEAQTPCAFYLIEKTDSDKKMDIYDYDREQYFTYSLKPEIPIPVFGVSIINKFVSKVTNDNKLNVYKSNLPSKHCELYNEYKKDCYINIHTCKLNGLEPELVIKYSTKECSFNNKRKLVMAHGMYGFPYIDFDGKYGISNRDKYVILREDKNDLIKLAKFFSTKTALYLFEATRYRMKYLEKYIFELIPDITKLADFPIDINDESIAIYFGLDEDDRNNIQSLHSKNYKFFEY
jgi:tRNA1(Val) A37 N6-methylase TrmN6